MDVQDVRRIREAFEAVTATIDRAAPHLTPGELVRVADQLEVVGRALTSMTKARPTDMTAAGDEVQEQRSHRMREDDR